MITSEEYIYDAALRAGAKYPELVVAQWRLESAGGTKVSGKNNIAGLKGKGTTKSTIEYVNGKQVEIRDDFLDFETVDDCIEYLVERWYKDYKGYKGVNNASTAELAAKMLVSEGYATDPLYAEKLVRIMSKQSQYADLVDAVIHFEGKENHVKAFRDLQADLTAEQRKKFTDTWRSASSKPKFPLSVPYYGQLDSKTGHGERMCFSSAMAMALDYLDPNAIQGDDDWYLRQVQKYGDTVSSAAQVKAAQSLGFDAQFRMDGSEKDLIKLLDDGIPVPIGILHKGPISNPTGGGHWVTLVGYDNTHFIVHDPYSELDLVNGGYPNRNLSGKFQRYTRKNLMRRWLIDGNGRDGWYMRLGR